MKAVFKKALTVAVALLLCFSLSGCALIEKAVDIAPRIFAALREKLAGDNAPSEATSQAAEAPSAPEGAPPAEAPAEAPEADGQPGNKRPELASLEGYWEELAEEWENAPNVGYVWTITIDKLVTMDVLGLAVVDYDLDLSCSHVGETMYGAYMGEMAMEYAADLSGLVALSTVTGGSVEYDADGWFKNGAFLMKLGEYDHEEDELFVSTLGDPVDAEEDAMTAAILEQYLGELKAGSEDFELEGEPEAVWCDWDFHMTEGDMSGYIQMTGLAYGTTTGGGIVDASGTQISGGATASMPGIGSFTERYDEAIENPFPYTIKVYGENVVMELFSANGGPVTVKFYGTIDKIPVEDTILP